jgi:hypothetical protein
LGIAPCGTDNVNVCVSMCAAVSNTHAFAGFCAAAACAPASIGEVAA